MADFGGGSPTGGLCYLSDGLPEQYRGKHFFSEWGKAGIFVTEVARDGATFRLVSDTKLIEPEKGGDFRPMQLSVAADGSLLIADWGYGGWKSPRAAGAIWRLSWPEAKPAPRLADESKATVEELIAALGHPDRDQRLRAQCELATLARKNETVAKALAEIVKDERQAVVARTHALWALAQMPGMPSLQPGGLVEISRGSSEATTPGNAAPSSRPGGAPEAHPSVSDSSAPAGAGTDADGKPRVAPGANLLPPSGLIRELVAGALGDKSPLIRAQAARVIGTTENFFVPGTSSLAADQAVSTQLIRALQDSEPAVRQQTLAALTRVMNPSRAVGAAIATALLDNDGWVRFAARNAAVYHGWEALDRVLAGSDVHAKDAVWMALARAENIDAVDIHRSALKVCVREAKSAESRTRSRAVAALGRIAYQPQPYDGHWWGTQPVKNPPPLNNVPWAGTPAALDALTAALSDPDAGVRLAAAKAFTQFTMPLPAPVVEAPTQAAAFSLPAAASSTPVSAFLTPCRRLFGVLSSAFGPLSSSFYGTVSVFFPPCQRLFPPLSSAFTPLSSAFTPLSVTDRPKKAADRLPKAAPSGQKAPAVADGGVKVSKKATLLAAAALPAEPKADAQPQKDTAALDQAVSAALAALRARLTAETDAAVRRQIIEALGVQKDAQAVDVFRRIALDETADAEFRETAIGAVVNIGGDAAKETIGQLAGADLSPRAMRRVIEAAGSLRVTMAAPALLGQFKSEDAALRAAAVKSFAAVAGPLMKPGGPLARPGAIGLIAMLSDKDGKVQVAAIEALGNLREKSALPALIALAEKKRSMKETIGALANMPDESAIPVLVETLREKNTGVRRNAIKALKTMRAKAWPQVEALLASGRVPEELVPEIRNAFESGAITPWKMVGVFENVWDAQHPPETEALAAMGTPRWPAVGEAGGAPALQFLAHKYHSAEGQDVGWIDVTADSADGRVNLQEVFQTSAMVCAYAFTEIDAPEAADAKLFTSADDEIAVWLNGERLLNRPGNHGYQPDANETALPLRAGKNRLFVKIGNKGGSWVFHARLPGFENGKYLKSKEAPPEEKQRLFALAAKSDGSYANPGDAKNGEKLFFDPAGALGGICATCHAVGAKGGQIGPALTTVGANYKRADLITSIQEPSKTIALGFEQVMLETAGGQPIAGSLRAESADAFTIVDAAGQPQVVKKTDVKKKTDLHVSLMPPGLTLSLKPAEFADLLAYLESLKGQ